MVPATIDDVAALAGVSTATVSRALRDLPNVAPATRDKVRRAAELLDYVADPAASALAAGRTNAIGLVVPTIGRWAHARLLEVVQDRAGEAGLDVLPVSLTSPAAREFFLARHPFRRRVDGLLVAEVPLDSADVARLTEGRPLVAIGLVLDDVDTVMADEAAGIAAATEHLLTLGHRDIAFIGASGEDDRLVSPGQRRRAFVDALATAGVVDASHRVVESQGSATGGAAAATLLLEEPEPPTAVIAASDEMALGAMEVARARGLALPAQLSVVGVDDQPLAQYVGLTTVHRDIAALGRIATDWLLGRLAVEHASTASSGPREPGPARRRVVATSLVVRSSTAPPG